jgi:leucyl aminopeptidase
MHGFATRPHNETLSIRVVTKARLKSWVKEQPPGTRRWLDTVRFAADEGQMVLVPDKDGLREVVLGLGDKEPSLWAFAGLPATLPAGRYAFDASLKADLANAAALGWALGLYAFDRYKKKPRRREAVLVWPAGCDQGEVTRMAEGTNLARDLINVPAAELGPAEIAMETVRVGRRHGARVKVIRGKAVLAQGYPTVFMVGQAARPEREPHLIDLRWGRPRDPRVTLVGKGVAFDSGGLDLKTGGSMRLMKKDMGGAASALGLAHMIMDAGLKVRLRLLIPAVENAVSERAFRPGDVVKTRKGITVEVGNTDAEGRLILCDALAEADSEQPDTLIDIATLTGAARVALGTELPALFSTDDGFADAALAAGTAERDFDPMWRMPLFEPYRRLLESAVADLSNVDSVGKGGAITAALFLKAFVSDKTSWTHVDTMAWNASPQPGRPVGGEAMGVRALYRAIRDRRA